MEGHPSLGRAGFAEVVGAGSVDVGCGALAESDGPSGHGDQAWAQTDEALASVAVLVRGLHDASIGLSVDGESWSSELADPDGGPVMCHNDVCLEDVVFHDGTAIALLDFDFAAPGRRGFDLAAFGRMCVPIARAGEFVRRRVEAGEVAFIEMWNNMGGQARFDRRRQWWSDNNQDFAGALR